MAAPSNTHTSRVERFRSDLTSLRPQEVIRKYITTGTPVALSEHEYFVLRNIIAEEFLLTPGEVVLVGSARIGFSVAPTKRYREVRPHSDLDIAIVSQQRFDSYWDGVFEYSSVDVAWKKSAEYQEFVRMLFNGWIDPRGLPNVPRFAQAERWTSFFDSLMQSRQFGSRRISARLYRTWSRLEAYQVRSILKCITNEGNHRA